MSAPAPADAGYAGQPLALLGAPIDVHSSYLRGAAAAPAALRAALASKSANLWTEGGHDLGRPELLFDAGDVELGDDDDELERIEAAAARLLARGARLVTLGGDHAITHPLVRAHQERYPGLEILHLDAHPDLYDRFAGSRRSHACVLARILEERLVKRVVQVGIRTLNAEQRAQIERFGVEVIEMRDWARAAELTFAGPVYLTFDLDVLDPAFAPGVSHWEPGGASTRQAIDLVRSLDAELVGADLVELNPARDPQGLSAMTAARIVREIAGKMLSAVAG